MAKLFICLCLFLLTQHLYLLTDGQPSGASSIASFTTHVPTYWKEVFSYNNLYNYPVTQTVQWTTGLKTRGNGMSLVATQELGPNIKAGQQFEITGLEFCYTDDSDHHQPKHRRQSLGKSEVHSGLAFLSEVEIPARTLLTKWQLVANVAGNVFAYNHTMDTQGSTIPHIHHNVISYGVPVPYSTADECHDHVHNNDHNHHHHQQQHHHHHHHHHAHAHAEIGHQAQSHRNLQGQQHYYGHHHNDYSRATLTYINRTPIHYGTTRILIRHMATHEYLVVARPRSRMSPATLDTTYEFQFILYNTRSGIRVRTMNPVYRGYEWLTSSASGQVHFSRSSRSTTQHWVVNKTTQLFDGDVVTFRNNGNSRGFLRYYNGQVTTQVYRGNGDDDEWMVQAA